MANPRNNLASFLPTLLGPHRVQINGNDISQSRPIWNFTGGGVTAQDVPLDDAPDGTPQSYTQFTFAGGGTGGPTISSVATGTINDIASDDSGTPAGGIIFTGSGNKTLTGIAGGSAARLLVVRAKGTGTLTLAHETTSVVGNRIQTLSGANLTIANGGGALLFYDDKNSRWLVVGADATVRNDIAKSDGSNIDRVQGFTGIPFDDTTDGAAGSQVGAVPVYNAVGGDSLKFKKPVPPGHHDVEDYGAVPDYLGGRTGNITSSSTTLTVNSMTGLFVGKKIAIDGVTGTKTITALGSLTVTLNSPADATVTGAAVHTDNYDAFVAALSDMLDDQNAVRKLIAKGWFYLGQTLTIEQTIHFEGVGDTRADVNDPGIGSRSNPGTWLLFPKNIDGIRVKAPHTGDPGGQTQSAERTRLRNLVVSCVDDATSSGHGVYSSIDFEAENVAVENFGGNGWHLYAYVGDLTGNVDLAILKNCYAKNCYDGFHIEGSEANAIRVLYCNAFANRNVGFYDKSGDGGTLYLGCHATSNATYNYQTEGVGNTSSFLHCYSEGGDLHASFEGFCTVIGGSLGNSSISGSNEFGLVGGVAQKAPFEYYNTRGARSVRTRLGEKAADSNSSFMSFETLGVGADATVNDRIDVYYGGDSEPWVILTDDNSVGYREFMRWPTLLASPRVPAPWFANGIYLGPVVATGDMGGKTQLRLWASTETNIPSRQRNGYPVSYEVGDIILEGAPTAGARLGRRCVGAGTLSDGTTPVSMPTATTTSGSATVTVSSYVGLDVGQYITIAGVTGAKKITSVPGVNITVDSTCDASVSGAAVAFVDPVFEELYAGVRPSVAMGSLNVDWSAGDVHSKTLSAGSNTITFSNTKDGQTVIVKLTGAASTVTWPTVKWAGGTPPTQTASGVDVYTFVKIGSVIIGSVVQDVS